MVENLEQQYLKAYQAYSKAMAIEEYESNSGIFSNKYYRSFFEFIAGLSVDNTLSHLWAPEILKIDYNKVSDNSTLQKEFLLDIICSIISNPKLKSVISSGKGQVFYLLGNAVASYSLYNTAYLLSKEAQSEISNAGIKISELKTRNKYFNLRDENNKKILTFEHMCPSSILIQMMIERARDITVNNNKWSQHDLSTAIRLAMISLLENYGLVAILTKKEDKKLKGPLRTKINLDIQGPLNQMLDRYNSVSIELLNLVVPVHGSMKR
ncbi:hypothetical protein N9K95_03635 [Schleiferiaceae bacterium]|nr:hypothetical protein [Schleiferiaceae bacterium]